MTTHSLKDVISGNDYVQFMKDLYGSARRGTEGGVAPKALPFKWLCPYASRTSRMDFAARFEEMEVLLHGYNIYNAWSVRGFQRILSSIIIIIIIIIMIVIMII